MLPCLTLTAALSHADSGEVNKAVECFTGPASHQIWAALNPNHFCVFLVGLFWLEFSVFSFWTATTCEHVFMTCEWSARYHCMRICKAWHSISTRLYLTHKDTQTHTCVCLFLSTFFLFSNSVTFMVYLFIWALIRNFCMNDIAPCSQCSVENMRSRF